MASEQQEYRSVLKRVEEANESLGSGNRQAAWEHFHQICIELLPEKDCMDGNTHFVNACMSLSQLGFTLGKNFSELILFLTKALEKADAIGDRRSRALINLHLGRLYYFSQRRLEASESFERGTKEVQELGDEDILVRSAEFIGLHYFYQGKLDQASHYFELGLESFETDKKNLLINVSTPMWAGYNAAYMGQFSRAIGLVDYFRRFCLENEDPSSASTLRAVLGIILLMAQKNQDAYHHLVAAEQEAKECQNPLAIYFAGGGLSYYHFVGGQLKKSHTKAENIMNKAKEMGIRWQYSSPIFLEMFYGYHRAGIATLNGMTFREEVARILNEPNIFMQGVALRLRALIRIEDEESFLAGKVDLEKSRQFLSRSSASVQLAKTLIELARLSLIEGQKEKARQYANTASRELGSYTREFYPDDLLFLLRSQERTPASIDPGKALLAKFMDVIHMLEPTTDLDLILGRVVKSVNRLLGAERGGVIWFGKSSEKAPKLRAQHNLTEADIASRGFRSNLVTIFEVHRTGQPRLIHTEKGGGNDGTFPCRSMLCIPIVVKDQTLGVLYYDNSYVDHCFEMLDIHNLDEIALQLSSFIERILLLFKKLQEQETVDYTPAVSGKYKKIVTQCLSMEAIIDQAEKVAQTDSSVLILGETGVGKELLARHIHSKSLRANKPFIVIDPSTMPENLVESELFGHEKGAFTGADRQRKGRLEMAHKGTLFIDEIGDIPLSIQVKLLRTLQEKTITRVGGTKELVSDFRLIAATHRDLLRMVADGGFRQDLFYRINVVPVTIPPLRERKEDVAMLARYFLNQYAAKYHYKTVELSETDEAVLTAHQWPGNIRELKNVMERTVLLSVDDKLDFNLPKTNFQIGSTPFDDLPTMDELQKRYILYVLEKTKGKQSGAEGAAQILGMKRSTLYNRMKKLGITFK